MKTITLEQFIVERQAEFPYAKGELSRLLRDIALAGKLVNREVNRAGLADILGETGAVNVQGERVKKMDVYANTQFVKVLRNGGECCMIASEENEEPIFFEGELSKDARYIVAIDPLDGSSNIDVNVSTGTIFSIYRRMSNLGPCAASEVMQPGIKQVAAGYIIYGSSTMLVYTTGYGVNGFTLEPSIGEFCLSNPNIITPKQGTIYSLNEGNYNNFPEGVKKYIKYCQHDDVATNRPYTARYIGSMIADVHRNLLKGGIFLYPPTAKSPDGKLRLVYECNPLSFIVEQAGGRATNGVNRILELEVNDIHQRTSIFLGSEEMVLKAEAFMREYGN